MTNIISEIDNKVFVITLNRVEKHNAFDDKMLFELEDLIVKANINPDINAIVLKAIGKHFCAGADLDWMIKVADYNEKDNIKDAKILANLMFSLYSSSKPTIVVVQGNTYGGGLGLIGACDIAIASTDAKFAFSELNLGLIPAVISPYIIKAIGQRMSLKLFLTTEVFNAEKAKEFGLIHYVKPEENLSVFTKDLAQKIANLPANTTKACKSLIREVADKEIDPNLIDLTANLIARQRSSKEGKEGVGKFIASRKNK